MVRPQSGRSGTGSRPVQARRRSGAPTVVDGRHAVLVVLEAMKMQIPVTAPWPGEVRALLVAEGDSVTAGQPLAEIAR